ncbi:TniQ family protein [Pseudomonas baltica]|uniref:TniQ family protein n=1 Tax=Pseudomonas baltica TaxID=2762576 RepID=UPI0039089E70
MLLRIQKNESLRSFVERSRFIPNAGLRDEAFKALSDWNWNSYHVKLIAKLLGWDGCYGFNKLLHGHTIYPWQSVLKSRFNQSYSDHEYISNRTVFAALSAERSYCPVCARDDELQLGYSYWRRTFPGVRVCAKHNVLLLSACQYL